MFCGLAAVVSWISYCVVHIVSWSYCVVLHVQQQYKVAEGGISSVLGCLSCALSDPCTNCRILLLSVRPQMLRQVEEDLPNSGVLREQCVCFHRNQSKSIETRGDSPSHKRARHREQRPSHQEVDALKGEVKWLKPMVQGPPVLSFHTRVEWVSDEDMGDSMSMQTSSNKEPSSFTEWPVQGPEPVSMEGMNGSEFSPRSPLGVREGLYSLHTTLWAAMARVGLDDTQPCLPPSIPFSAGLQQISLSRCCHRQPSWWSWHIAGKDPHALAHHSKDSRIAAMCDAGEHHTWCVASLVVLPLRP